MTSVKFYDGIEDLHGKTAHPYLKIFLITKPYVSAALIKAFLDRDQILSGGLNYLEGPGYYDPSMRPVHGRTLANDIARGKVPCVCEPGADIDGEEIVLVDIVTYPHFHCIVSGLGPYDLGPDTLWKVNHNILARYADAILRCGYLITSIHRNEQPIDDAPAHNLVAFSARDLDQTGGVEGAIRNLARNIPSANIVSHRRPYLDDRYCLNERLARDPACEPLEPIGIEAVLL